MKSPVSLFISVLVVILISFEGIGASEKERTETLSESTSPQTRTCIACHSHYTPGIVHDWLTSRHAKTVPSEAMKKPPLEKRFSAESLAEGLKGYVVGCYECHSQNPEIHKDSFDHMGQKIHVVVTPQDCKTCHPVEFSQFSVSKKSYAYKNLMENPVYHTLVSTITGLKKIADSKISTEKPTASTLHETCLGCHGTVVEVSGVKSINSKIGTVEVPHLTNWPNQGVGRINPDGSRGACTACHPRHSYSIETARKPYTCAQCHLEPDVPAWNVYHESKHGNIFFSKFSTWNFDTVPWVIGNDFKAPTCATCHNSLLVSSSGNVIAERTHDFGSRLWVRLFGLIYSHAQPKSGDTTVIRNKDGLPLPATFTNEPASEYLIDKQEQEGRVKIMSNVCNGCHSTQYTQGHFTKLEKTVAETNTMTLTATQLVGMAWDAKLADRINPFDETIEQMWMRQWLFYTNSIRYASAMTGAPDYASFKNGWWYLTENIAQMREWIELRKRMKHED
jgi:hypothetical protein